jgi:DNA-binding YbaB/EbfC family protein
MFGNLGNLAGLLKSAKDMQAQFAKMQEELAAKRFDGDAGGGLVRVTVNGKGTLLNVKIDPQAATDIELLEDMVKAAVAAATAKSQEAMKSELSSLTGGLNLPGLTDLLGPTATG